MDERIASGPHPAGRRGFRPGVRLVQVPISALVPLPGFPSGTVPALECITCGALLMPGSPLAVTHVEQHRGPRWRRALRDARIRARRRARAWGWPW